MYPRRKTGSMVEIEYDQEGTNIVLLMGWVFRLSCSAFAFFLFLMSSIVNIFTFSQAMEPHPLHMPLNPQSHLLAQKCPMEPGDSQWDEAGLPYPANDLITVCYVIFVHRGISVVM